MIETAPRRRGPGRPKGSTNAVVAARRAAAFLHGYEDAVLCDCGQGYRLEPGRPDSPCAGCKELDAQYRHTSTVASTPHEPVLPSVRVRDVLDPHRLELSELEALDEIEPWPGALSTWQLEHPQPYRAWHFRQIKQAADNTR